MKIGIFTDAYEPHISGVTTSITMLKKALEQMGHKVYIVTANLVNNKFYYDKKNEIICMPGMKIGICGLKLANFYSNKAMKIIRKWDLDIIHSQTEFGIGVFSRIVAKKLNIPVVHTYHTLYEDYVYYITHGYFDKLSKKIVIQITKYFCDKKCDELIVPTNKIKDLFVDKYDIKHDINVIPTGIDTKRFELNPNLQKEINKIKKKYKIKDTDFIIGTLGRVAKEKSLDKLINSFNELLKKDLNVKLMIVGDGPYLGDLKQLVKNLNIEKKVIFIGQVKNELTPIYYNLFDVMTSFSTSETQGLTIIEALAASKPVVCINDDSFKEMVQDKYNGYLFKTDSEFIKYVLKLKEDSKLYKEMSNNAINSVYKYSKEVFASDVLKLYYKAIK